MKPKPLFGSYHFTVPVSSTPGPLSCMRGGRGPRGASPPPPPSATWAGTETARPWRTRGCTCSALIDGDDLLDLPAFLALTNTHLKGGTWADLLEAGRLQSIGVQEHVSRSVRQLDKSETLLGIIPLHRCFERRRGGWRRERREHRRRRCVAIEIIIIKTATTRLPLPVILRGSHCYVLCQVTR